MGLVVGIFHIVGELLLKAIIGDAEDHPGNPQGGDGHKAADAGRAAGIEDALLQDLHGDLPSAFPDQVEFRMAEDDLGDFFGILPPGDDLSLMDQNSSEGIVPLDPGFFGQADAFPDEFFMSFHPRTSCQSWFLVSLYHSFRGLLPLFPLPPDIGGGSRPDKSGKDHTGSGTPVFHHIPGVEGSDGGQASQYQGVDAYHPSPDIVPGAQLEGGIDEGCEKSGAEACGKEEEEGCGVGCGKPQGGKGQGHPQSPQKDPPEGGVMLASEGQDQGACQGAQGHPCEKEAIACGTLAQVLLGEDGNHDVEVHGEGGGKGQEEDGQEEILPPADVAKALKDAHVGLLQGLCLLADLGRKGIGTDQEKGDEDGDIAGAVDQEAGGDAHQSDEEPPHSRAQDAG